MLDHLGLQAADVGAATTFYCQVFAAVGLREAVRHETPAGDVVGLCGPEGFPDLWLAPREAPGSRPVHLALTAPSREAVDAVHTAALAAGAEVLHAPRVWPEYHPGYYAVFLRDPDGNNVEAVHHTF
ncbi:VOC family protein [Modestobacter lapidis]|nr:VOC family protein [Modestobacter lapidis]